MSYLGGGDLSSDGPSGMDNNAFRSAGASAYESDDWKTIGEDSDEDQSDTSAGKSMVLHLKGVACSLHC